MIVRQQIHPTVKIGSQTRHEPGIVGVAYLLYFTYDLSNTPGINSTPTRFLSNSQSNALIKGSCKQGHLSGIRTTGNRDFSRIGIQSIRLLFYAINKATDAPRPGAVIPNMLQLWIETKIGRIGIPLPLVTAGHHLIVHKGHLNNAFKKLRRQRTSWKIHTNDHWKGPISFGNKDRKSVV